METCDCGWPYPAGFAITPNGLPVQGIAIQCPKCRTWMSSDASMEIGRAVSLDDLDRMGRGEEKGH